MAARKATGDRIEPRDWTTMTGALAPVPHPNQLTHIQFRRFAGCPVCNLHLRSFVSRHDDLVNAGVHEIVVFHSPADELLKHASLLPFDVIPDPTKRLYKEFGVESSAWAILHPRAWWTIMRAVAVSLVHVLSGKQPLPSMNPDGGRNGLPADLIVDGTGRILEVHYGKHAGDQLSVDDVLALAQRTAHQ
ncbi:peroxiredoxin-like family protein [Nocardia aobensis]|uniref:peroxiredoxin-like family protein n=1 Tax=Nocardia aobensis TaxID=257277 RepID=UPI0009FFC2B1|nr:peroxiredoxin-like family protein [Nocardia aobensis]